MDSTTVSLGTIKRVLRVVAVIGAGLMVASLFMDWFEASNGDQTLAFTGWDAFEFSDVAFVLVLLVAAGLAVAPTERDSTRVPALVRLGVATTVIVVIAVASSSPVVKLVEASGEASIGLEEGAYLGMAGGALIVIAGLIDLVLSRQVRPADTRPA